MRVLILTETLWPYGSGGELATYLFVRLLPRYGVHVRVVVRKEFQAKEWYGIEVYRISSLGYGKYFVLSNESRKLIMKLISQSDIVYFASSILDIIPLAKSLGKPVIVHVHSYFPACPVGHFYNFVYEKVCTPYERSCRKCILTYESMKRPSLEATASCIVNSLLGTKLFLRYVLSSDALVFVSKAQQELFLEHIRALRNCVPVSYVIHNPLPDVERLPVKGNDVGFLGGLDPIKGFNFLLKAWLRLFRKYKHIKLRVAMSLGLPDMVERVNIVRYPRLRGSELVAFYEHCRVIVVPSICPEPSPYVVIETLLKGRLLIASNIGGIPEIIGNAPGVKLVSPRDIDSLVDALDWVLSMDSRDVIELGLKNRECILRRFSNDHLVRELIKVFDKVMHS